MTSIQIKRQGHKDITRAYQIELDGSLIGSVKLGEVANFDIQPGKHHLRLRIDWCSSNGLDFSIRDGQTLTFECGNNVPLLRELIYVTFLRDKYLWLKLT